MADEPATVTYLIAEPFEQALRSLRKALFVKHLNVSGGFDISARVRRRLFIGTAPSMVLFVSPSRLSRTALETDPCAAALGPFHIVVSERGGQTEIHVLRTPSGDCGTLEPSSLSVLNQAHSEILRALQSIRHACGNGGLKCVAPERDWRDGAHTSAYSQASWRCL